MLRHITTRVAGLIILVAGLWGGLIPFVGPYFHFTLGPDHAWAWTNARLWLVVLPAAASVLGGLVLMGGGPRISGRLGALIALAGGAWFAVGPDVSRIWNHGISAAGAPHGHHVITRMLEFLTLHSGIGVLITALAAYSLPGVITTYAGGRRHRVGEDAALAGTGAAAGAAEMHHRDRVAAERGGAAAPVDARDRVADREGVPVAESEGAAAPVAKRDGTVPANEAAGAAPANEAATTANDPAAEPAAQGTQTETATRRRGGLFSRR